MSNNNPSGRRPGKRIYFNSNRNQLRNNDRNTQQRRDRREDNDDQPDAVSQQSRGHTNEQQMPTASRNVIEGDYNNKTGNFPRDRSNGTHRRNDGNEENVPQQPRDRYDNYHRRRNNYKGYQRQPNRRQDNNNNGSSEQSESVSQQSRGHNDEQQIRTASRNVIGSDFPLRDRSDGTHHRRNDDGHENNVTQQPSDRHEENDGITQQHQQKQNPRRRNQNRQPTGHRNNNQQRTTGNRDDQRPVYDSNQLKIADTTKQSKEYLIISRSDRDDDDNVFALFNLQATYTFPRSSKPKIPFLRLYNPQWNLFNKTAQSSSKNKFDTDIAYRQYEEEEFYKKNCNESPEFWNNFYKTGSTIGVRKQPAENLIECPICKRNFDPNEECIAYTECSHMMCIDCCVKCIGLYQSCPVCRHSSEKLIMSSKQLDYDQLIDHSNFNFETTEIGLVAFHLMDAQQIEKYFRSLLFVGCTKDGDGDDDDDCRKFNVYRFEKNYQDYFQKIQDLFRHIHVKHNRYICMICITTLRSCIKYMIEYKPNDFYQHLTIGNRLIDGTPIEHVYCHLCGYYLFDNDQLWEHCKRDHLSCYLCNSFFAIDMSNMIVHYRQEHCYCSICNLAFQKKDLEQHKRLHPDDQDIEYCHGSTIVDDEESPSSQQQQQQLQQLQQQQQQTTTTTVASRGYIDQIDLQFRRQYKNAQSMDKCAPIAGPSIESYMINFPAISSNVVPSYPSIEPIQQKPGNVYDQDFPSLIPESSSTANIMTKTSFAHASVGLLARKEQPKSTMKNHRPVKPSSNKEWKKLENDKMKSKMNEPKYSEIQTTIPEDETIPPSSILKKTVTKNDKKQTSSEVLKDKFQQSGESKPKKVDTKPRQKQDEWPTLDDVYYPPPSSTSKQKLKKDRPFDDQRR
ncbi:hypothetical protein HUG17_0110 [Dermatophagoides farinae]|uniref:RING-type domain-containing protein n=1 Tax=Dermatophagoides farinae TaxID=6954 RepID=A0A9D4SJU3_DERFA|nr:hypothetical protein HUG17_0110 [Dermatophagoides farinae]